MLTRRVEMRSVWAAAPCWRTTSSCLRWSLWRREAEGRRLSDSLSPQKPRAVQRPDSEVLSMSDLLRDRRLPLLFTELNPTFSQLKIDGAEAADDDNESGYSSVSHFLSDDDQSTCPSDPSLHSERSKEKNINLKKLEKCDPDRYQMWQHLQNQRERLRVREERFLADLPPHDFLSDDDQSSRPSNQPLRRNRSTGKKIDLKKSEKNNPARDRAWQLLQKQKKLIQMQEELVLARLPPDCFLSDDDQSACPSDPSLHSDWSNGQLINFKKLEKCDPDR
ncbi:uncharacterized protein [Labrus bergylta]|uniref:uncharacterized protein n=1 Tax=Labrus bergylta TaxID=56723 RepID=UPI0033135D7D